MPDWPWSIPIWRCGEPFAPRFEWDSGAAYFDQSMKDALLPPENGDYKHFKAKVVSHPSPKELLVSVDDPAGDATLEFALPLRGTIAAGQEIEFSGVARKLYAVALQRALHGRPESGQRPARTLIQGRVQSGQRYVPAAVAATSA